MKTLNRALLVISGAFFSAVALATPGPYDAITDAIDWSEVVTGVVAVAALIAGVLVAKKGARMLLSMLGR